MLDQTRDCFTGLSDEPCLGADLLAPADSEANSSTLLARGLAHLPPPARGWRFAPLMARGLSSQPPPR
jgi:hypothetical protein